MKRVLWTVLIEMVGGGKGGSEQLLMFAQLEVLALARRKHEKSATNLWHLIDF